MRLSGDVPAYCARIIRGREDARAVGGKARDVDLERWRSCDTAHAARALLCGRTACECAPKIRISACERRSKICVLPPASPATSMRPSPRNDAQRTGLLNRVSVWNTIVLASESRSTSMEDATAKSCGVDGENSTCDGAAFVWKVVVTSLRENIAEKAGTGITPR